MYFAAQQNKAQSKLLEFVQQPELLVLKTAEMAWKYKQISPSSNTKRAFWKAAICETFFR